MENNWQLNDKVKTEAGIGVVQGHMLDGDGTGPVIYENGEKLLLVRISKNQDTGKMPGACLTPKGVFSKLYAVPVHQVQRA